MRKIIDITGKLKKKERKKIIFDVLFVAIIFYIIYVVYLIMVRPTEIYTVENGTLAQSETLTGYVVRDENVVKGKNYKNGIYQIISEGQRAAKDQIIFRYYGQNEEKIQAEIEKLDTKIQQAMQKEKTLVYSDVRNLEGQIDNQVKDLRQINDIQKLSDYKKKISEIILKKAKIVGENSKSGSYIKELIEKREEYEEKLIDDSEYMEASEAGVISYRVDGLENVLTIKGIQKLTEQKLNDLNLKTGRIVSSSNEAAKIMNNFECYLVGIFNSEASKEAKENQNVLITLASGTELDAKIAYKVKQKDGKYLIAFKLNTLNEELISYRKLSFNVTWWTVSGLKVPNSTIKEEENELKYVTKKKANITEKCYINVLKTSDNYSIIKSFTDEEIKKNNINSDEYKGINRYDKIVLYID